MWPYDNTRYGDRKEVTSGRASTPPRSGNQRLGPAERGWEVAVERREDDLHVR